jgi:hypothetical protein
MRHIVSFEITLVLNPVIYLAFAQAIVPWLAPIHERVNMPVIMKWAGAAGENILVE